MSNLKSIKYWRFIANIKHKSLVLKLLLFGTGIGHFGPMPNKSKSVVPLHNKIDQNLSTSMMHRILRDELWL